MKGGTKGTTAQALHEQILLKVSRHLFLASCQLFPHYSLAYGVLSHASDLPRRGLQTSTSEGITSMPKPKWVGSGVFLPVDGLWLLPPS